MKTIKDKNFVRLISKESINKRITELAGEINTEYRELNPLFLAILNGSFIFAADLFKSLDITAQISFIKVRSYAKMKSEGKPQELIGLNEEIKGRHLIILEDIVDTGQTLSTIIPLVKEKNPASIKIMTLLYKPAAAVIDISPDYVGFSIEPDFVVGYGLDYDGYGRNLPEIMVFQP